MLAGGNSSQLGATLAQAVSRLAPFAGNCPDSALVTVTHVHRIQRQPVLAGLFHEYRHAA